MTVAGIVPALRQSYVTEVRPVVYLPFIQCPLPNMTLIARLRSESDAPAVAAALGEEVRALDADLPLYDIRTLDEVLSWSLWVNRVFGGIFAIFAGMSVLIATVGIYGRRGPSGTPHREVRSRRFGTSEAGLKPCATDVTVRLKPDTTEGSPPATNHESPITNPNHQSPTYYLPPTA
jgi:hypothetical protein